MSKGLVYLAVKTIYIFVKNNWSSAHHTKWTENMNGKLLMMIMPTQERGVKRERRIYILNLLSILLYC